MSDDDMRGQDDLDNQMINEAFKILERRIAANASGRLPERLPAENDP